MQTLIKGIAEFKRTVFEQQRELYERLAAGQSPEALFITCVDSRIDPNLLTQTLPGELLVHRNPGNIIPPSDAGANSEAATIEFAVEHLGIEHLIVCGHSHCGAMKALLDSGGMSDASALSRWIGFAGDALTGLGKRSSPEAREDQITQLIQKNVLVQLENLRTHRCVDEAIQAGRLQMYGWFYRFETGNVLAYHPGERNFVPLVG